MARSEASVSELVGMIERREIQLPEMQRKYVWRSPQVKDLIDSLYKGYPSGAILLWESVSDVPLQDFAVSQDKESIHSAKLLLDGQQRLTSLSAVIRGEPVEVRKRKRPIEILFNLDHPERADEFTELQEEAEAEDELNPLDDDEDDEDDDDEDDDQDIPDEILKRIEKSTFVVSSNKIKKLKNWISVSEVFAVKDTSKLIKSIGITDMDDPKFDLYNKRLNRLLKIADYPYRLDILDRSLTYDEVTEIFVRVNSLGTRLRGSDLALAQITARWRGSLKEFQNFENKCAADGFPIEVGLIVRNLVATITSQSKFLTVANIAKNKFIDNWQLSQRGAEFAIDFLRGNCGISRPALLSSTYFVPAISYFAIQKKFKFTIEESALLKKWVLIANAKARYSLSSSESVLDQDLATIRDGGSTQDLLNRLETQVGRFEVLTGDLVGKNIRSSLFKTLFIALNKDNAQDWSTSNNISLYSFGVQNRLQYHHIFPKAVLKNKYRNKEIDDIANLAFISGGTNRKISAKKPEKYLPEMIAEYGEEVFKKHLIPLDIDLSIENYPKFLEARRKLIADRINQLLLNNN